MRCPPAGRVWDEASGADPLRRARLYEAAWRASPGAPPDPAAFLPDDPAQRPAALLALLRSDLALRREARRPVAIESYRRRFGDLDAEVLVALIYEDYCLREEAGEAPEAAEYEARFPEVAAAFREVLEIHGLVAEGPSTWPDGPDGLAAFPEAGQTIAGFHLVEELGRGAFGRVFRAEERQLADRPVALKVTRAGSREPQTLARLQHTHIVPVHSYRTDPATGLHLLCMPYLGRVTLARLLEAAGLRSSRGGAALVEALDRLEPGPAAGSAARRALAGRTYARAIAWWGARLAEALQFAHERGVLHLDVKPSNVLITGDGLPMLLDFNLARAPRTEPGGPRVGGTLGYMAPEQLEGLVAGHAVPIDHRADIYALGVVLFEALAGRPFSDPSQTLKRADGPDRLIRERHAGAPRLRAAHPEVPPALEAVVRRCLEPEPAGRYAAAAELAADLQAVADDAPLRHASEPLAGRALRWLRRRRRRIALATPAALTLLALGLAQYEARANLRRVESRADQCLRDGDRDGARGEFVAAEAQYAAAAELARGHPELAALGRAAERRRRSAHDVAEFSRRADALRSRLLGFGDPEGLADELKAALRPFAVLDDPDWWRRGELDWLGTAGRSRLLGEIDDLLFLWVWKSDPRGDPETSRRAVALCDRALAFAESKGPWRALRARHAGTPPPSGAGGPAAEPSARACFQWALLRSLDRDIEAALAWLERAARLRPGDYWSHFVLAYFQQATAVERALAHYDVAIALRPDLPWARVNRAGLYWSRRGAWDRALDDLTRALADARGRDKATVRLEQGLVLQRLGDLPGARAAFEAVLACDPYPDAARLARLGRASLDIEAGATGRAWAEYDALLARDPAERRARLGRALLALRLGRAAAAEDDLGALLRGASPPADRAEVLEARALARLALGRPAEAVADAAEALRLEAGPGRLRLRDRALLAAGRPLDVRLSDPDEVALWPCGGPGLAADLRAGVDRLATAADAPEPTTALAASRLRALSLAALGAHAAASAEADRLVERAPHAASGYRARALVRRAAGDRRGALADVAWALALEPDEPRLLELRGRLALEAGDPRGALADFDRAILRGAEGALRGPRATALMALGRDEAAVADWSRALEFDPADPAAYLGRARAFLRLGLAHPALADLERAADWAGDRPAPLARIALTYARALRLRPDRLPRVQALARRAAAAWLRQVIGAVAVRPAAAARDPRAP
jgi:eukaryotic-like serine/threonine-protein kinase